MKRIKVIGHLLFSFRGRISRRMWWVAQLVAIIFMLLVGLLLYVVFPRIENANVVVFLYWSALLLGTWTYFAISIKRLHDRNRSWAWALLGYICLNWLIYLSLSNPRYVEQEPLFPLLLFVGFIYPTVQIAFLPGKAEANRYGPPPQSLKAWWDC